MVLPAFLPLRVLRSSVASSPTCCPAPWPVWDAPLSSSCLRPPPKLQLPHEGGEVPPPGWLCDAGE